MSFQDAALSTHFFWLKFLIATTYGSFWTVVLEKTLESSLDCKKVKPVNPKGNQSWLFIGRTDAEAGAPILWPPDAKSQLTRKDRDAGKDRRREEKGTTEDEMVGWHHQLDGHEFKQVLGDGEGHGSLVCCSPWGYKVHGIHGVRQHWVNNIISIGKSMEILTGRLIWSCQGLRGGGNVECLLNGHRVPYQFSSVVQSCPTLCDPMDCSTPGFPVHNQLPEFTQTHVHRVGDAFQPSHPLSSPSPPTFNLSQHQGLFKWVGSSRQVAKVLEFQLQHQSFQWTFKTDFL